MAGRGRNKPHRQHKSRGVAQARKAVPTSDGDSAGGAGEALDASLEDDVPVKGPVPRVCMDYFYVSSRKTGHALSTKELQRKLRELGKSDKGSRGVLIGRYEKYADLEDQEGVQAEVEREGEENRQAPHASERPMMVMVDALASLAVPKSHRRTPKLCVMSTF